MTKLDMGINFNFYIAIMMPLEFKQDLISKFPHRDIDTTFKLLLDRLPNQGDKYFDLLLIANEFREINQDNFQGVAFYENIQVRINRIRKKILYFIRDLKEGDFWGYTNISGIEKYVDGRDGTAYRVVELFGQLWLGENLAFNTENIFFFYDDDPNLGSQYGKLYTFKSALEACIPGWHLPSEKEIKNLRDNLKNSSESGSYKEKRIEINRQKTLLNEYFPDVGGERTSSGKYQWLEEKAFYWTTTPSNSSRTYIKSYDRPMDRNYLTLRGVHEECALYCRCIKDD